MDRDYVVRKRVENQAIVREVDHDRQRELYRLVLVGALALGAVLFAALQHFEARWLEKELVVLQQERAIELEIRRHLQLEIAALSAADRIERVATGQLRMVAPDARTATILERVTSTPASTSAVVAAR
jgi:cell division protein FtsL